MKKPNIIVYLSDQQRHDTMGCYGQRLDVTPAADKLAGEGVQFMNAFSCQPVCGPARACIQTGRFPTETGAFINQVGLKSEERTIAHALADVGYETAYVGKWHLASDYFNGLDYINKPIPLDRMGGYKDYLCVSDCTECSSHGYDGFLFDKDGNRLDFVGYRCDCITDYAIHYLQTRKKEDPFFLFLSHIEPHQQNDRDCYEGPDGSKERFRDYDVPPDLLGGKYEGDWRENYPDYLGACRSLDDNLAKLIRTLKSQGIYEDTVIIYASDHGNHFRTQDGEYKRTCFDSSLHIPLIISGGPFRGGRKIQEIVSLINLPATILSLAGAPLPEDVPYAPLQNAMYYPQDWPKEMFFQVSETELGRGIRTARWKYYVDAPHTQPSQSMPDPFTAEAYYQMLDSCRADSPSYVEKYLFDLENDPYEKNNLIDHPQYKDVRAMLAEILVRCMVEAKEGEPVIYPSGHVF